MSDASPPSSPRPDPDLYPFASNYFNLDGQRMHYLDEGTGPPVVLLHGNPTWSFYFRDLVRDLRDTHRVIVPDHLGCGLSDKPQDYDYTLARHVANLERLLDHVRLDDVTLGVHDWGGAIGMGWAVRHVERVRRLVIFNTAAFLGGRTPWRIRICRWPGLGSFLVRRLNGFARAALLMATAHPTRFTRAVRAGYLLPYDSFAHRVAVWRFVRDIPVSPAVPSHAVIRAIESALPLLADKPMLIAWGMKDFCFTPGFLNEWIRRFPRAEVHRFPDAGHYVVEDAADRILPLLREFLTRTA